MFVVIAVSLHFSFFKVIMLCQSVLSENSFIYFRKLYSELQTNIEQNNASLCKS